MASIFRARKNMAASIRDTDSIVSSLETGLGFLVHFLFAAAYLGVWGIDIITGRVCFEF